MKAPVPCAKSAGVQGLAPGPCRDGGCRGCGTPRAAADVPLCQAVTGARNEGMLAYGARRLGLSGGRLNHYSGLSVFAQYAVVAPNAPGRSIHPFRSISRRCSAARW
jgi:alcohol dehydrogenase